MVYFFGWVYLVFFFGRGGGMDRCMDRSDDNDQDDTVHNV